MLLMAAFDSNRYRWIGSFLGLGAELVVHATRSVCDGSVLNAESGRADTRARLEEWTGVLSLYYPRTDTKYDVPLAAKPALEYLALKRQ